MKKTISISLAHMPFIVEDDAYQKLDTYLSEIKAHFANTPDAIEVVADIEARIAEQFIESGKKVITAEDVAKVIASMGSVHEFAGGSGTAATAASAEIPGTETKRKRLYRNPDDKVIAGVASGIAAYIGADVVWVRLGFILFTLMNGFGILLYIAFWIATTEAKSASQRLEMTGTPVTLETLSERVKERVEEVKKEKGTFKRIITLPFRIIGAIFTFLVTKVFPIIGKIIGAAITVASAFALLALSVVCGLMIFRIGGNFIADVPLSDILSASEIILASITIYLALGIPLYFLLFLGTSLLTGKRNLNGPVALALVGVWFLVLVIGSIVGVSVATRVDSYVRTNPEYRETERRVEVGAFNAMSARNGIEVKYVQDSTATTTTVVLAGRAKDLDRLIPIVKDGVLVLEPQRRIHERPFCIFCDFHDTPTVTVSAPGVTSFEGMNGVRIEASGITSSGNISIHLANGAHGAFDVHSNSLEATIENGVYLELTGSTTNATLTGANGTRFDASGLTATQADISITNASEAVIGPTTILNAKARNGAEIRYAGDPLLTEDVRNGARVMSTESEWR